MADARMIPKANRKRFKPINRFVAPRATLEERFEAGKALRDMLPRESHATYQPSASREDPIRILEAQNAERLPQLVPVG